MVVAWNDLERTLNSLRSIEETHPGALLVLVDNASEDDPTAVVRSHLPAARVVRLSSNRGYAGGCNAGVEAALAAGATHVLLLNNDATLEPGALDALLDANSAHPNAILAPLIVYADRPDVVWSAGGYLVRPFLENHHLGKAEARIAVGESRPVEWATGCALFVSAETYRRLGPLDEAYFLYLEDTDWCLRGSRQGIPTFLVPTAVVRHEVSSSVNTLPSWNVRYYAYRNHYRLALRHAALWARPLILLDSLWTLAKAGLRSAISSRYRNDRWYHARTAGVLDFLRGRFGAAPEPGRWTRRQAERVAT